MAEPDNVLVRAHVQPTAEDLKKIDENNKAVDQIFQNIGSSAKGESPDKLPDNAGAGML